MPTPCRLRDEEKATGTRMVRAFLGGGGRGGGEVAMEINYVNANDSVKLCER